MVSWNEGNILKKVTCTLSKVKKVTRKVKKRQEKSQVKSKIHRKCRIVIEKDLVVKRMKKSLKSQKVILELQKIKKAQKRSKFPLPRPNAAMHGGRRTLFPKC